MSKYRSNLAFWLAGVVVMACNLSAGATTFYYPTSGMSNRIMDPANWNSERNRSGFNPTTLDFANAANEWVFFDNKYVQVAPNTNPATNFRIAGPVTYRSAVGVSGVAADRFFLFNGNLSTTYSIVATFDDLRIQGTIEGRVTRTPWLAGNLSFIADGNGIPAHSAFQIRTGNQLNITALVDAAECNSIDVLYYLRPEETTADSQISLRNPGNRIYSKFVLDAGLYGYAAGSLGDADVYINGGSATDARGGKLTIQNPTAISSTAKVSIVTATGINTDAVRINLGTNNVTIRELWIDGVQQTGSPATFSSSSAWLAGSGTLTVTNTATRNLTMAASPADPNIKIYPPVGVKAYAEGYVVSLHAPNPKNAPYKFDSWSCVGGTVANPAAADTTVTVPVGSDISVMANYVGAACSPLPVNTQTNVSVFTGLSWTSAPAATAQTVYFGTDNPPTTAVTNVGDTVSNAALGGRLSDSTTYYWFVASTIGGNVSNGSVWSFATADSKPHSQSPANGVTVPLSGTYLAWSEDPVGAGGTSLYSVYMSTSETAVTARTAPTVTSDPNGYFSGPLAVGQMFYWAVDVTYRDDANGVAGYGTGPVWNFNSAKRTLTFKTNIPAYSIDGAADVNGYVQDGNVAVFKFPSFSYDSQWNIVVTGNRAVAIWSDTGIDFGATMDISGGSVTSTAFGVGVAGGFNGGAIATRASAAASGPGYGDNNWVDMSGLIGAGAGFGGAGGKAARYSDVVHGAGGITYSEPELYTFMLGGSGGAGSKSSTGAGGGGGGGAVELYARGGNINVQSPAVIRTDGGSVTAMYQWASGGGSGGAVRLIASGNVTVAGTVSASGGAGGSTNSSGAAQNCGGGGGGGRVAAYRGGTLSWTGPVTANGGAAGYSTVSAATYARPGQSGTIYTSGATSTLLSAHAPIPANGNMTWNTDPNFGGGSRLSWVPALGSLESKIYFGTSQAGMTLKGTYATTNNVAVGARSRIYHTVSPALAAGTRYYWRVDTNGATGPVWSFATGTCTLPMGDLNADCKVTFKDLRFVVDTWLACNLVPASSCN